MQQFEADINKEMVDIEKHLLRAEEDIRNGRVKDARKVFKDWKEKYGVQYKISR